MLIATTDKPQGKLSKTTLERTWEQFINGGTNHSSHALILPWLINECHIRKQPFELTAHPGRGYYMKPILRDELE